MMIGRNYGKGDEGREGMMTRFETKSGMKTFGILCRIFEMIKCSCVNVFCNLMV